MQRDISVSYTHLDVYKRQPTFFILHSQKNTLREWYSYLETVILELLRLRTDRKTHKMFENAVEYFERKKVIGAFAPTLFNIIKEEN